MNVQTNRKTELKKQVSQLRRKLKENFDIAGDPFEPSRKNKSYRTKFRVLISGDELNENTPQDEDDNLFEKAANRYEDLPAVKKARRAETNQSSEND